MTSAKKTEEISWPLPTVKLVEVDQDLVALPAVTLVVHCWNIEMVESTDAEEMVENAPD